jgi:hypothetical protein
MEDITTLLDEKKPFRVGYATSGRSMCKGCNKYIKQDTLRIGKMVQSTKFDGEFPLWHHFKCFFKSSFSKQANHIALFHGMVDSTKKAEILQANVYFGDKL